VRGLFPVINLLKTNGTNMSKGLRSAESRVIFSRATPNSTSFKVAAPLVANPIFRFRILRKKIALI